MAKSLPSSSKRRVSLPVYAGMSLETFYDIYPTWLMWQATEKRFLPTQLRAQPKYLMDGLLYLDGLFEKMLQQQLEQEREALKNG